MIRFYRLLAGLGGSDRSFFGSSRPLNICDNLYIYGFIKFSHLTLAPKDVLLQQSMVFQMFIAKLADFLLGKK